MSTEKNVTLTVEQAKELLCNEAFGIEIEGDNQEVWVDSGYYSLAVLEAMIVLLKAKEDYRN